jgi:hypothetical protein
MLLPGILYAEKKMDIIALIRKHPLMDKVSTFTKSDPAEIFCLQNLIQPPKQLFFYTSDFFTFFKYIFHTLKCWGKLDFFAEKKSRKQFSQEISRKIPRKVIFRGEKMYVRKIGPRDTPTSTVRPGRGQGTPSCLHRLERTPASVTRRLSSRFLPIESVRPEELVKKVAQNVARPVFCF